MLRHRKAVRGLFIGLATLDVVYRVEQLPRLDEKIFCDAFNLYAGGPALNAAITYSILGGDSILLSRFGACSFSRAALDEVRSFGVTPVELSLAAGSFPISSIFLSGRSGSRTVVSGTNPTEQLPIEANQLASIVAEIAPTFILIDGHYLDKVAASKLRITKDYPIVVDAGSWKACFAAALSPSTIVIAGKGFIPPTSGMSPAEFFSSAGIQKFAQTFGAAPVHAYAQDKEFRIEVPSTKAADTLAAGDVFHGAFSYFYFVEGQPFELALESAACVAANKAQFLGPREGVVRTAQLLEDRQGAGDGASPSARLELPARSDQPTGLAPLVKHLP